MLRADSLITQDIHAKFTNNFPELGRLLCTASLPIGESTIRLSTWKPKNNRWQKRKNK